MASWKSLAGESAVAGRLLLGLPRFLDAQPTVEESRAALARGLRDREHNFLDLIRRGVCEHPGSPYRPLLERANLPFADVERYVRSGGIDGALDVLYDAGVRISLDEFKGRRPIRRGALTIDTAGRAFDNPLLTPHYEAQTSGSRGVPARFLVDLELLAHETHYDNLFLHMFGLTGRPGALWHPAPPGSAGLKWALRMARLGRPVERWFSQTPVSLAASARHATFIHAIHLASRAAGRPVPLPEYTPLADAPDVARWLAAQTARGAPAWISTTASCAVRICLAAARERLDVSGTFVRSSGEPLTPARQRLIVEAGCRVCCHYSLAEVSRIGVACGGPSAVDEVHVAADKVAVRVHDTRASGGTDVRGLALTTLVGTVPKVMVNVELGDSAVEMRRACGCVWEGLGFEQHLHTIRSYEKLTSEGMHFVGADVTALLDETLPARFGGGATDYQFAEEEEEDGLPVVSLLVSPRVGPIDEGAVRRAVLDGLASHGASHRMMAAIWCESGALRVLRREPVATPTGKIHALHVEARRGAARDGGARDVEAPDVAARKGAAL